MSDAPAREHIFDALAFLLEETFPGHPQPGNAYLDSGTGWRHSLEGVDHTQASRSFVPGGTTMDVWDEDAIVTMFGLIAHSAYHLGAVRQMRKAIRER